MRLASASIEPIRKTRTVALEVERAFELFTTDIGTWWPLRSHSIAEANACGVRFEGRVGGRVVELTQDGDEHEWADVIAWDPPHRFVLAWHPNPEPTAASVLEVRFESVDGGTRLNLEHRGWEEFGDDAGRELRAGYDPGWDAVLTPFEELVDSSVERQQG